jgi:RimJ/RimL family protein N-acetyltransferase
MEFITDRLFIRPLLIEDKASVFKYRSDSESNKYQSWIPREIKDVEVFIENVSNEINVPETWFQFVILEKQANILIGDIGIHFMDSENKQVEVGCTLNRDYQGNGYATESLRTIIDYLINTLDKHRVIASIDPRNSNSIRLVERLGFKKEAHFVESFFSNGKWQDDLVYALLAREWRKAMIRLEKFTEGDFERLINWIDNEYFMHQFAGPAFGFPLTHHQLNNYITESNRNIYRVVESSSNRIIGHAEINRIDSKNKSARLCRILIADESDRNKGYGRLIIKELLKIGFDKLKLHRIDLGVFDFNESAIKCYEHCGFKKEGLLRDSFVIGNEFHSVYNMSILKEEWKS